MEQPWHACEYALESTEVARQGEVRLEPREGKLVFRGADRDAELSLAAVEAVKQEGDLVCLRQANGTEARLRLRDAAFVAQLAREMAREQPPPETAAAAATREKPRVKLPTLGFAAFRSVEVVSPTEVAWQGENYVIFAVRARVMVTTDKREQEEREWVVYHRYSDFEKFDQRLRNLVNDYLDTNLILLPILPQKPWLPQSNREFVESRSRKLDRYIKVRRCQCFLALCNPPP